MVATEPSVFEKSSETDVLLIVHTFLNTFYTVKMPSGLVQIKQVFTGHINKGGLALKKKCLESSAES